ncbi:exodeoxyribonuclease V subunit beta [Ferrimonas senticii]|uniref:exodeoxyribonuclease V subunit beta n=1 Tax=Ferrimonas senticii TaxID=394566 RepID=UPI0003F99161|nr:exodeoxyribonuclease V subunit beta [Ferrimonas senticii]
MAIALNSLTFPLGGTRLIEASAGTGKTYTIAALYLRLVLGHGGADAGHPQGALTPEQILVVTFTKAATEELKDRIRARLVEAAMVFRSGNPNDEVLTQLLADYPIEQHPRCARLLEVAAQSMDQAAVHTIHSWCQRMLREHAFDSGSLFNLELETDLSFLEEEAVRDYWRSHFYQADADSVAALAKFYQQPRDLQLALRPLLGKVEGSDDPLLVAAAKAEKIERCKAIWRSLWPELKAQLTEAIAKKQLNGNKVRANHPDKLEAWLSSDDELPEGTLATRYTTGGMLDAAKKGSAPLESPAFAALENLNIELEKLDLKQTLLRHAADWVNQRIIAEKQRLALLGHDDLINDLGSALATDDGQLAAKIRHQFPVALIDEFQDTDPIQYGIFSSLYLNQSQLGLMMIGDPKQAIYAFRGADIYTYLQARDDTAGHHYTLGKNFRSTAAMVTAANALFEQAQGYPDGAFMYQQRIPFESVAANGKRRQWQQCGQAQAAMHFIWQPSDDPISKAEYLALMSEQAAERITLMLNQGQQRQSGFVDINNGDDIEPVGAADIAVLVRDFTEANAIRSALAARGVRSVYLSDKESVYLSDEAADLRLLLTAAVYPQDDRAVRAALACRTLGLNFSQLELLSRDERAWEQQLDTFKTLQLIWQQQGILPMLRQLLVRFDVAQRLLHEPDLGERRLTNLLHLAELLQAAAAGLDGELALLRYLTEQCSDQGERSDEQVMRLESDAALVKVITIHKSKGLQYKLVFLPFILSFRQAKAGAALFYRDADGANQLSFNPDDEAKALADRERLAEDIRLLYVAITRAEYACYLGLAPLKIGQGKKVNVHLNAFGKLLADGAPLDSADIVNKLEQLAQQPHTQLHFASEPSNVRYVGDGQLPPLPAPQPYQRQPFGRWWVSSYSGLLAGMSHSQPAAEVESSSDRYATEASADQLAEMMLTAVSSEQPVQPQPGTIHAFPKGAAAGTFLHDLFEWACQEQRFQIDAEALQEYLAQHCPSHGFAGFESLLAPWFVEALQVPLPLNGLNASLLQLPLALPELEFWFAVNHADIGKLDALVRQHIWPHLPRPSLNPIQLNGMLKGFIDLTFYVDGRYYVADYKSNYLGADASAYQPQAMQQAMLEHRYDLQAALYTLALHRLLKSRLADYDFDRDIGGGLYLFLRGLQAGQLGQGALTVSPSKALIEQMDQLFRGAEAAV